MITCFCALWINTSSNFAQFSLNVLKKWCWTQNVILSLCNIKQKQRWKSVKQESVVKGNQCKRTIIGKNRLFRLWRSVTKHRWAVCIILKHLVTEIIHNYNNDNYRMSIARGFTTLAGIKRGTKGVSLWWHMLWQSQAVSNSSKVTLTEQGWARKRWRHKSDINNGNNNGKLKRADCINIQSAGVCVCVF